jgi:predicted PurR-regulated permease PerM
VSRHGQPALDIRGSSKQDINRTERPNAVHQHVHNPRRRVPVSFERTVRLQRRTVLVEHNGQLLADGIRFSTNYSPPKSTRAGLIPSPRNEHMAGAARDLTRTTLAVLLIVILIACSLGVIRPFLPATIWAVTIVVATWPLLLRVQAALWHSRALAVAVTTLVILLVFVAPFWLAATTILRRADQLTDLAQAATALRIPALPQWLYDLPLIGPGIAGVWNELKSASLPSLAPRLAPYAGRVTQWFVGAIGSFGLLVLQFLLTVIITAIIQSIGEAAARLVLRFGYRLAGARGEQMVTLVGHAIRAVAIGVMVTALVESAIGGMGLAVVGVPLAAVLTAVKFVFCIAQVGPGVVLLPAVIWMYASRSAGPATLLLAISVVAICAPTFAEAQFASAVYAGRQHRPGSRARLPLPTRRIHRRSCAIHRRTSTAPG